MRMVYRTYYGTYYGNTFFDHFLLILSMGHEKSLTFSFKCDKETLVFVDEINKTGGYMSRAAVIRMAIKELYDKTFPPYSRPVAKIPKQKLTAEEACAFKGGKIILNEFKQPRCVYMDGTLERSVPFELLIERVEKELN